MQGDLTAYALPGMPRSFLPVQVLSAKLRTRCRPVLTSQTLGTRLMNSELSVSKATHCQASCLPYDDARKATAPQAP